MNPSDVVRLENVSVIYRTPKERIGKFKEYFIRRLQGRIQVQTIMALRGISLCVHHGEVFGLIGHNGAGKTTTLRLVARVMRPTSGRIWVEGRVAPLLELGAGFHPELTARENIYLNGAILGFTRHEMREKLPHIVDFAELWDFLDMPMRAFSSGMWARLGFAVATDTQPDILIIDEVLAVGDESFQRKSLERIRAFRDLGTTIILVSHSMSVIERMCQRAAWLDHGEIIAIGPSDEVVQQYREHAASQTRLVADRESVPDKSRRWGSRKIEIKRVRLLDGFNQDQLTFQTGKPLVIEMDYFASAPVSLPIFGLAIHRHDGIHLTGSNTGQSSFLIPTVQGSGMIRYQVPSLCLLEGLYELSVVVHNQDDTEIFDYHDRLYSFHVINPSQGVKERYGMITLQGQWTHRLS